jgi:acetoacetate decarboxylase
VLAGEYSIGQLIGNEFHGSQYDFIDALYMHDAPPFAAII